MHANTNTVTIWQSGKLAPHRVSRGFEIGRTQWLGAALLVLSAIVLGLFVAVLERDVGRGELRQAEDRSQALAEVAPSATPDNAVVERANDAPATTVSLLDAAR